MLSFDPPPSGTVAPRADRRQPNATGSPPASLTQKIGVWFAKTSEQSARDGDRAEYPQREHLGVVEKCLGLPGPRRSGFARVRIVDHFGHDEEQEAEHDDGDANDHGN
jgi:hypothetical protein